MNTVYCIRDYVYIDGTVKWKSGKYYDFLKSGDYGIIFKDSVGFNNWDMISE